MIMKAGKDLRPEYLGSHIDFRHVDENPRTDLISIICFFVVVESKC